MTRAVGSILMAMLAATSVIRAQVTPSSDARLALIRQLEDKGRTRPAFDEDEESSRRIEEWHAELVALIRHVSSLRDPRAAAALATYINEPAALTRVPPS